MHFNEIQLNHIKELNEDQLNSLLYLLLWLEAGTYEFQQCTITVPLNAKSKDGGIDGKIEWNGNPPTTPILLNKTTVFQNKATELTPAKCYEEILLKKEKKITARKLKPEIEDVVKNDWGYVLFTTQPNSGTMTKARIDSFRKAIKDAGMSNWNTLDIRVFDANFIVNWVNQYISAIETVQRFNGVTKPIGLRNWKTVVIDTKANLIPYMSDSVITDNISFIQNNIIQQKVIRIVGHSGIGKTRLVIEAFRPVDNLSKEFNAQFLYSDIAIEGAFVEIYKFIISVRNTQGGILVIDNCDSEKHKQLADLVKSQGKIKIITIGLDNSNEIGDAKILIERQDQNNIVERIVEQQIGSNITTQDIRYITSLCEGYPWMAVRFSEVIKKSGIKNFDKSFETEAIEKLIFGNKPIDKTALEVIRACSIFSAFGFVDDTFSSLISSKYRDSIEAQTDFIRTKVCSREISHNEFNEICLRFKKEGVMEQHGVYCIVKPSILAIQLASQWYTNTSISKIISIIKELDQVNLEKKFFQRLTDLNELEKVGTLVKELFSRESIFGTFDALNTERGSKLFGYAVEIEPDFTCDILKQMMEGVDKKTLMGFYEGRRNTIWALEKLCFRKDTFFDGTTLLFRFAINENEQIVNNATGQLKQLFSRFLAGTEANYDDRIEVLNWALKKDEIEYTKIAIQCMSQAFIPIGRHFRTQGAENIGGRQPLVDYIPQKWEDIQIYWNRILSFLITIADSDSQLSSEAIQAIASSIRTLIKENCSDILVKHLNTLNKRYGKEWIAVKSELRNAFKNNRIPTEIKDTVRELIGENKPKTLKDEIYLYISKPDWVFDRTKPYKSDEKSQQQLNVEQFATKLITEKTDWKGELPTILKGEQRQGFSFGKKIGELAENTKEIVYEALEKLKEINSSERNFDLVLGLIRGVDRPEFYKEIYNYLLKDEHLKEYSLKIPIYRKFELDELFKLFELVDDGSFPVSIFTKLNFNLAIQHLKVEEIKIFVEKLRSYGILGYGTAFELLFMYCYYYEENWDQYKQIIRNLLKGNNLLFGEGSISETYYWSAAVKKLLDKTNEVEFATVIAEQLLQYFDISNFFYTSEDDVSEIIALLMDQYFEIIWPTIGEILNSDSRTTLSNFTSTVGVKNGFKSQEGILFSIPEHYEFIYQWAEENEKGRIAIAYNMPFFKIKKMKNDQDVQIIENTVHPFAKGFIDRFGDQDRIQREINANVGSFSIIGSVEPYYQQLIDLFETLNNHESRSIRTWAKKETENYKYRLKYDILKERTSNIDLG